MRAFGQHKLNRPERVVADLVAELQRGGKQLLAHFGRQPGCGRFLDDFLVVALDRALALEQVHELAVAVAGELHFEVARPLNQLFKQHAVIAKGTLRLVSRQIKLRQKIGQVVDPAHAFAAAAGAGLDQQRRANGDGLLQQVLRVLVVAVIAGHARHTRARRNAFGFDLRAHALDDFGARADPFDAVFGATPHQLRALGQEAITRMNRTGAAGDGRLHDGLGIEVAARRVGRPDGHASVGLTDVAGLGVGVGIHGDRANAQAPARADDPAGNFAPVGNQDAFKHRWLLRQSE